MTNVFRRSYPATWPLLSLRLLSLVLLVGLPAVSYGQGGSGTIRGAITDQTGATIPDATITVINTLTGLERKVATGSDGVYVVPFEPVGRYSISASKSGFKSETRSGITLTADQILSVDIGLTVGNTAETVEVHSEATMINTTGGTLSQIIDNRTVTELPLNGRDPGELAYVVPGAVRGDINSAVGTPLNSSDFGWGHPGETAASVNGSRSGGVYYMLDGVNHMDSLMNSAYPFPNPDATEEFRVLTNNFDAQYGFSPGAVVSIVTKSGTNNWHGSLFEYLRNDMFDATDYFSHSKTGLKRNQFGASLGGPIIKNKLFAFVNYQGTLERLTVTNRFAYVPTNANLNGDFSYYLTPEGGNIQLHYPDGTPIPGNIVDPSTLDGAALKLESALPHTDDPTGLVNIPASAQASNTHEYTVKVDYDPNETNRVTFRAYLNHFNRAANSGNGDFLAATPSWYAFHENYAGNWVWTPKPNLVNNFLFAFTRTPSNSLNPLSFPDGSALSFESAGINVPVPPGSPSFANLNVGASGEFFNFGSAPTLINRHDYVISEKVAWTAGKHLVIAGMDVLDETLNESSGNLATTPQMIFDGSQTGTAISDFLFGDLQFFTQGAGDINYIHGIRWAGFLQDTYHVKSNLTINAGLRWEPSIPSQLQGGRLADFVPGQQSTRFPNAPVGLVYAGDRGIPRGGYHTQLAKFEPRLGLAWQPKVLPGTSIRAAFAMMEVPMELGANLHQGSNAPFSPTFQIDPTVALGGVIPFDNPWAVFEPTGGVAPFPPFAATSFVPQGSVYAPPSDAQFVLPVSISGVYQPANFSVPTVQTWNLSIEHELRGNMLLRAAYIGTEAYHLGNVFQLNPGIYAAGGARTIYPDFGSLVAYESRGTASYNAFQFSFEKRFSHGVQVTSNYSYSKNIDDGSVTSDIVQRSRTTTDPFDMRWNRGISDLNLPQILTTYGIWQLPALSQQPKPLKWVLGSWQLSGVWTLHSGLPFSIRGGNGNNNSAAGIRYDRADLTGQPFNVHQGTKQQWLQEYFNADAFTFNAPGTFGDSPRNALQGPGWNNLDFSIMKNFPFGEQRSVQFRCEMFNALNRTEFAFPGNVVGDPGFGQIVQSGIEEHASQPYAYPRIIQLGLRVAW
jgi:hypothetical protein